MTNQGNIDAGKTSVTIGNNKQIFVDKLLPHMEKSVSPNNSIFGGFLRSSYETRLRKEAPSVFREHPFDITVLPSWRTEQVTSTKSVKMPGGTLSVYLSVIDWRWATPGYELVMDLQYWPDNIFLRGALPIFVDRVSVPISSSELQQLLL